MLAWLQQFQGVQSHPFSRSCHAPESPRCAWSPLPACLPGSSSSKVCRVTRSRVLAMHQNRQGVPGHPCPRACRAPAVPRCAESPVLAFLPCTRISKVCLVTPARVLAGLQQFQGVQSHPFSRSCHAPESPRWSPLPACLPGASSSKVCRVTRSRVLAMHQNRQGVPGHPCPRACRAPTVPRCAESPVLAFLPCTRIAKVCLVTPARVLAGLQQFQGVQSHPFSRSCHAPESPRCAWSPLPACLPGSSSSKVCRVTRSRVLAMHQNLQGVPGHPCPRACRAPAVPRCAESPVLAFLPCTRIAKVCLVTPARVLAGLQQFQGVQSHPFSRSCHAPESPRCAWSPLPACLPGASSSKVCRVTRSRVLAMHQNRQGVPGHPCPRACRAPAVPRCAESPVLAFLPCTRIAKVCLVTLARVLAGLQQFQGVQSHPFSRSCHAPESPRCAWSPLPACLPGASSSKVWRVTRSRVLAMHQNRQGVPGHPCPRACRAPAVPRCAESPVVAFLPCTRIAKVCLVTPAHVLAGRQQFQGVQSHPFSRSCHAPESPRCAWSPLPACLPGASSSKVCRVTRSRVLAMHQNRQGVPGHPCPRACRAPAVPRCAESPVLAFLPCTRIAKVCLVTPARVLAGRSSSKVCRVTRSRVLAMHQNRQGVPGHPCPRACRAPAVPRCAESPVLAFLPCTRIAKVCLVTPARVLAGLQQFQGVQSHPFSAFLPCTRIAKVCLVTPARVLAGRQQFQGVQSHPFSRSCHAPESPRCAWSPLPACLPGSSSSKVCRVTRCRVLAMHQNRQGVPGHPCPRACWAPAVPRCAESPVLAFLPCTRIAKVCLVTPARVLAGRQQFQGVQSHPFSRSCHAPESPRCAWSPLPACLPGASSSKVCRVTRSRVLAMHQNRQGVPGHPCPRACRAPAVPRCAESPVLAFLPCTRIAKVCLVTPARVLAGLQQFQGVQSHPFSRSCHAPESPRCAWSPLPACLPGSSSSKVCRVTRSRVLAMHQNRQGVPGHPCPRACRAPAVPRCAESPVLAFLPCTRIAKVCLVTPARVLAGRQQFQGVQSHPFSRSCHAPESPRCAWSPLPACLPGSSSSKVCRVTRSRVLAMHQNRQGVPGHPCPRACRAPAVPRCAESPVLAFLPCTRIAKVCLVTPARVLAGRQQFQGVQSHPFSRSCHAPESPRCAWSPLPACLPGASSSKVCRVTRSRVLAMHQNRQGVPGHPCPRACRAPAVPRCAESPVLAFLPCTRIAKVCLVTPARVLAGRQQFQGVQSHPFSRSCLDAHLARDRPLHTQWREACTGASRQNPLSALPYRERGKQGSNTLF